MKVTYSYTSTFVTLHHHDCMGSPTLSPGLVKKVDTFSTVPHIWCTPLTYSYRRITEQYVSSLP